MRLTTIILIASLTQVSAASFAQLVTLNKKNVQLETVLKDIRQQTGYDFYYDGQLTKGQKIDINVTKATVDEALKAAFKNLPLNYTIDGQIISITKKNTIFLDNIKVALATIDVHGKVVDNKGMPLPGVTVKVKNEIQGTVTNDQGEFTLKRIDEKSVLVISYLGYLNKEINALPELGTISLVINDSKLDEVQIIAYGQVSKRFLTSNITSIKASEIADQPITNPLLALEGRVPGLFVQQTTGVSGGAVNVTVQGKNSMDNGNDPFYVIDGVPYPPNQLSSYVVGSAIVGPYVSAFSFINPSDIESIEILKDADATAIYGSRAANGAILITTKKGKIGKTSVDVNMQSGAPEYLVRPPRTPWSNIGRTHFHVAAERLINFSGIPTNLP